MKNKKHEFKSMYDFEQEEAYKIKDYKDIASKRKKLQKKINGKEETREEYVQRWSFINSMNQTEDQIYKTYAKDNIKISINNFCKIGFYNNKFYLISEIPSDYGESCESIIIFQSFEEMLDYLKINEIQSLSELLIK